MQRNIEHKFGMFTQTDPSSVSRVEKTVVVNLHFAVMF